MNFTSVILGITSLLFAITAFAVSPTDPLHHINSQIVAVKGSLSIDEQQQEAQQTQLQSLETEIATSALNYEKTNEALKKIQIKIATLKAQAQTLAQTANNTKNQLISGIKTEYVLGNQSDFKILLEQTDLTKIERLLTYYRYLNHKRIDQIDMLKKTMVLIQNNLTELNQNSVTLKQLTLQELSQLKSLEKMRKRRHLLIATINKDIQTQSEKLTLLVANKKRLESELAQLSQNTLFFQASGKPFSILAHHLNFPTKGTLNAGYDPSIAHQIQWDGSVLFNAPLNQPVYAVADGKVIFARWLSGYGLLMIIYHGQGYMTLYGRNHYLYKKTGDTVHAGDLIAAVGESGGYQSPALYFAIRHNTTPENPMNWFKRTLH